MPRIGSVTKAGHALAPGDMLLIGELEYEFVQVERKELHGWVVTVRNPRARSEHLALVTVTIEPWRRYALV